jgi:uncharacterized protein involved in outer membrane biogenesis
MSRGRKIAVGVLITLAVLLLAGALVGSHVVNLVLDRDRPEVTAGIERGTGRSVRIGRLSVAFLPVPAVRADDVAIRNPPGFPDGHFMDIERVYAELDVGALVDREIVVRSLQFDHPVVNLLSTNDGRWNTEGPEHAGVRPTAWTPDPAAPSRPIARVRFEHGRVTVSSALPTGVIAPASFEANEVAAELDDVNPDALGLNLTPARLRYNGPAAPRRALRGVFDVASLVAAWLRPALLEADEGLTTPRGPLAAHGTFSAKSERFNAAEAGELKSDVELYAGGLMLRRFSLDLAGGHLGGDFVWNSADRPASFTAQLALGNIDLARLLAGSPGAANKITGTLEGQLRLSGLNLPSADPLANKEGVGQIVVRNGTLPTLQLNRNLVELMKNILNTGAKSGDPSSFRSISADLEIGGGEIHSRQITILGNGMDLDASGALALGGAGRLNYEGVAKMTARRNGFEGIVAGLLGSKISADGRINVPFTIAGTVDQPRFALKNARLFH